MDRHRPTQTGSIKLSRFLPIATNEGGPHEYQCESLETCNERAQHGGMGLISTVGRVRGVHSARGSKYATTVWKTPICVSVANESRCSWLVRWRKRLGFRTSIMEALRCWSESASWGTSSCRRPRRLRLRRRNRRRRARRAGRGLRGIWPFRGTVPYPTVLQELNYYLTYNANRSEQSEVSECLLNRCNLFRWARIFVVGRAGCGESEQLFAMCNPGTLGHKAMLARNPFLDLLIRGALTGGFLVVWRT